MKSKSSRFMAFVLVAMMLALAACAPATTTPPPTASEPTAAPTTAAATAEATAAASAEPEAPSSGTEEFLTLDYIGFAYGPVPDDAPVKTWIEEQLNCKINVTYLDQANYADLISVMFASGDVADVFGTKSFTDLQTWARQGLLAPVEVSRVREVAPNMTAGIDAFLDKEPNMWKYYFVDGVNYSFPVLNIDGAYTNVTIWRDDWLANVGIGKIPETLAEFEEALYKFAKEDPDQNGKHDTYGLSRDGLASIWGTMGFYFGNITTNPSAGPGGGWIVRDGQVVNAVIQPEVKGMLELFAKWYQDGVIDPEFVTGENTGGYWAISHAFTNGRIGMTGLGSYYHWTKPIADDDPPTPDYQAFIDLQPEGSYAFGKPAVSTDGKGGVMVGSIASGATMVFGSHLETDPDGQAKMDRILMIADLGNSSLENYLTYRYGFEGTHWDKSSFGFPTLRPEYQTNEAWSAIGAHTNFFGSQNMIYYKEHRKHMVDIGDLYCADSYLPTITGGLPSDSKYRADIDKLKNTMLVDIISGTKPVDYFDTFVTEWKAAGGDILTQEANEWITQMDAIQID